MVILMLERVPVGLRGELSRWLIEPRAGVFVGNLSALVRDKLWEKVQQSCRDGAALLIHSARTEQGFRVRSHGDPSRQVVDLEGLTLIRIPTGSRKRDKRPGPAALSGSTAEAEPEGGESADE